MFIIEGGVCVGILGLVLVFDIVECGKLINCDMVLDFELRVDVVIVCLGGIGGNFDLV